MSLTQELSPEAERLYRCLTPVMVDGHTRCRRSFEPWAIHPLFAAVLDDVRRRRTQEEAARERQAGGRWAKLPVPQTDLWMHSPTALVTVSGERNQVVAFYVPDVVHVTLNVEQCSCRVDFKAKTLWSWGFEKAARYWLGVWNWLLTGRTCSLEDAHREGWDVVGLELCADYTGIKWRREDAGHFVGLQSQGDTSKVRTHGRVGELAETVELGTRKGNVSLCLYDKTRQIVAAKGGDDSTYAAAWRDGGWDGKAEVARAEVRLSSRGLRQVNVRTGELLNFRDPMTVANQGALAKLWAHAMGQYRLIEEGTATRRKRCKTDERWSLVQSTVQVEREQLRQDRQVQRDAYRNAVAKHRLAVARGVRAYAALHGLQVSSSVGAAEVVRMLDWQAQQENPEHVAALYEYGNLYREQRETFMGEEMHDLGGIQVHLFEQHMGRRMLGVVQAPKPEGLPKLDKLGSAAA